MRNIILLILWLTLLFDIQAQSYKTIEIKNNEWMDENLSVTKFRNGNVIFQAFSKRDWDNAIRNKKPAWCYYKNNSTNNFGKIYNWYAVIDTRGLAPRGYHIPSMEEWREMIIFLGENEKTKIGSYKKVEFLNSRAAIKLLKKNDSISIITNYQGESGFNGIKAGCRSCGWPNEDINGFSPLTNSRGWWTITDQNWDTDKKYIDGHEYEIRSKTHTDSVYIFVLNNDSLSIIKKRFPKNVGFYVRCLKDKVVLQKSKTNLSKTTLNNNEFEKQEKLEENMFCFYDRFNSGNSYEITLLNGGKAKIQIKNGTGLIIRTGQGTWEGYNDGPGGDMPNIILKLTTGNIRFSAVLDPISSSFNLLIDTKGRHWEKCG